MSTPTKKTLASDEDFESWPQQTQDQEKNVQLPGENKAMSLCAEWAEQTGVTVEQAMETFKIFRELDEIARLMLVRKLGHVIAMSAHTYAEMIPSKFCKLFAVFGDEFTNAMERFEDKPRSQLVWMLTLVLVAADEQLLDKRFMQLLLIKDAPRSDMDAHGEPPKEVLAFMIEELVAAAGNILGHIDGTVHMGAAFNQFLVSGIVEFAKTHSLELPAGFAKFEGADTVDELLDAFVGISATPDIKVSTRAHLERLRKGDFEAFKAEFLAADRAERKMSDAQLRRLRNIGDDADEIEQPDKQDKEEEEDNGLPPRPQPVSSSGRKRKQLTTDAPTVKQEPGVASPAGPKVKATRSRSQSPAKPRKTAANTEKTAGLTKALVSLCGGQVTATKLKAVAADFVANQSLGVDSVAALLSISLTKGAQRELAVALHKWVHDLGIARLDVTRQCVLLGMASSKLRHHAFLVKDGKLGQMTARPTDFQQFCNFIIYGTSQTVRDHLFAALMPEMVREITPFLKADEDKQASLKADKAKAAKERAAARVVPKLEPASQDVAMAEA